MWKNLIISILAVLIAFPLTSQQEYQIVHYGSPGTIYLYNRIPAPLFQEEVRKSGEGITWDVSGEGNLNTHANEIVNTAEAANQIFFISVFCSLNGINLQNCLSIWNSTEQAFISMDSLDLFGFSLENMKRFHNKSGNFLLENFFGFSVDFNGMPTDAVIIYQTPDTVFHFPITYDSSWSSATKWSLDLTSLGQNLYYTSKQNRSSRVDAWGTLVTPYDTLTNVIRLRSEIQHTDTLVTDSSLVPVNLTQVEYLWFDTSYKLPIMIANGFVFDSIEAIGTIEYIYDSNCEAPTWQVDTDSDIYYLDSTGSVTVHFVIEGANADVYQWDLGDGTFDFSSGNFSHTYTIAGDISVGITGCMTNCLPLNSCSDQIVDFQIIDTLSSVEIAEGGSLGIRLYPNPAKGQLYLAFPEGLAFDKYRIISMDGRIAGEGELSKKNSTIAVETLQPGVYSLLLTTIDRPSASYIIMRFAAD